MRNVNQKSLRYYERIGVLTPAYTDPETGYRYYALEQLVEMDMILMCLELNIPLRDAVQYHNTDETLDIRRLLRDGQQKAREKLTHLQATMAQGTYRCQQRPARELEDVEGLAAEYFKARTQADRLIITNLTSAQFDLKTPVPVLQEKL